jgi:hypothetical protein
MGIFIAKSYHPMVDVDTATAVDARIAGWR